MDAFTVTIYPRGVNLPPRVANLGAYAARPRGIMAARRYAAEELLRLRAEGLPGVAPGDETALVEGPAGERLVARLAVRFREAAGRRVTEVVWAR